MTDAPLDDVPVPFATYDKRTGTAGTMRIVDTGSTVEFWILCSDPATNCSLTWSGRVNGTNVGGTVSLSAGFSSRRLNVWTVSSNQTVTFHINATGTQGIAGPTDHAATITRSNPPGAPGKPVVSLLTEDGGKFTWTAAAANGAAITNYGLYVSRDDFKTHAYQAWVGNVLTKTLDNVLVAGQPYKCRVRAQNAAGIGPYSAAVAFKTLSGVYVSDGLAWLPAELNVSDGVAWLPALLELSTGAAWQDPG